jgi:hypothetical protein
MNTNFVTVILLQNIPVGYNMLAHRAEGLYLAFGLIAITVMNQLILYQFFVLGLIINIHFTVIWL